MKLKALQFPTARLRNRLADEEGGITALSIQMFVAALVLGGLAVDFGNAVSTKTHLQVAADAAAHAAIYTRELNSEADAKAAAISVAAKTMPAGKHGTVLKPEDIVFGTWNASTRKFTAVPGSRSAVMVSTKRFKSSGNGVTTYMLGLAGFNAWDVASGTVFETYYPSCFREGFVAKDRVEFQSNSIFGNGFCVHSQKFVKVSSNNTFEKGVVVSMPDKRNIQLPSSGYTSNPGLQEALRDGSYNIRILNRIDSIIQGVNNPTHPDFGIRTPSATEYYRSYITSNKIEKININQGFPDLRRQEFKSGSIHTMDCKNDKTHKTISADISLVRMVLITDCRLQIMDGARIEDAVIITTNDDPKSVYGPAGVVIGKNDKCAAGGDVQIVTKGGVDFASGVSIYGSQILAAGDISVTANADGIEGVSFVAGGKIDATSNGAFGFCNGAGMVNSYEAAYFRLAG